MADLIVTHVDEVNIRVMSEDMGIMMELSEFFTFMVPGAKFMPSFKNKIWDGKVRLYNMRNGFLYAGLLPHLKAFADQRDYTVEIENPRPPEEKIDLDFAKNFYKVLNPHAKNGKEIVPITADDFQATAFAHAVNNERALLLSPTASGKSLIIYGLTRYCLAKTAEVKGKVLIVVPTTSLVEQMYKDFAEYSVADEKWNADKHVHLIYSGKEKETNKRVVITTWQSIFRLPAEWFEQFHTVIGDEAHTFAADSLKVICGNLTNARYRYGLTGTLTDAKCHKLVLEGLFGQVYKVTTTKELIDQGRLSDIEIHCLMLQYPEEICTMMKEADYQKEMDYIVENARRNKLISGLALGLKGNTLILFQLVQRHGKILHELIKAKAAEGRRVFFVHGGTDVEDREQVRAITEREQDAIIIASYGTFSAGINIKNLHNIIFASPSKSPVRVLQSIGRGLRKTSTKCKMTLYDIVDVMMHKKHKNHTLRHFLYRLELYNREKFSYKSFKIPMS